jgi:hypothetical protein
MTEKEKDLELACCDYARSCGLAAVKLENNKNTGIPDRLFIGRGGKVLFVEFKRKDKGVASHEQLFWLKYLGDNGILCDDYDEFKVKIRKHFKID